MNRGLTCSFLIGLSMVQMGCGLFRRDKLEQAQNQLNALATSRSVATGKDVVAWSAQFSQVRARALAYPAAVAAVPTPPPLTLEQRAELDRLYSDTIAACESVMMERFQDAQLYRNVAIGMAIVGSIAGGLVPVLTTASAIGNAEWIAGLGTISGAMNGLQSTMSNQGASYEGEADTRRAFLTEWKGKLDAYSRNRLEQNYDGAIVDLADALTTCRVYRTALNARVVVSPTPPAAPPTPSPTIPPKPSPSATP